MPASMFFGRGGGEEDGGGGPAAVETFHFTKDGLNLWLQADAITGLTDGQTVGTWSDSSALGNNATQATEGNKPTYQTNILNGKPIVRFASASSQYMISDNVSSVLNGTDRPFTVISVPKVGGSDIYSWGRSSSDTPFLTLRQSANLASWKRDDLAAGTAKTTTQAITSGQFYVFGHVHSGTAVSLYFDGVATSVAATADDVGATTVDQFTLGCLRRTTNSAFYNGDLAEILVYNRALSVPELRQVERYLGNKYNITIG